MYFTPVEILTCPLMMHAHIVGQTISFLKFTTIKPKKSTEAEKREKGFCR